MSRTAIIDGIVERRLAPHGFVAFTTTIDELQDGYRVRAKHRCGHWFRVLFDADIAALAQNGEPGADELLDLVLDEIEQARAIEGCACPPEAGWALPSWPRSRRHQIRSS